MKHEIPENRKHFIPRLDKYLWFNCVRVVELQFVKIHSVRRMGGFAYA